MRKKSKAVIFNQGSMEP